MRRNPPSPSPLPLAAMLAALLACSRPALPAAGGDRITGQAFASRSEVIARHGMAATSQPLATQVALDVLKRGGSAVDAAIAANALLGLVEPTGNGLGGDLFAIVWDARTQKLYGLNGSGRSPVFAHPGRAQEPRPHHIPPTGPLPVSVPGACDAWFELHGRFGKLPIGEVLAPAIGYAREGFPVSELISYYWNASVPRLSQFPGFKETYTVDGVRGPKKGEIFKQSHSWRTPSSRSPKAAATPSTRARSPAPSTPT